MKIKIIKKSPDESNVKLNITFDKSSLQVHDTPFGFIVNLDGCSTSGEIGGPGLPSFVVRIALPALTEAVSVSDNALKTTVLTREAVLLSPVQSPRAGYAVTPFDKNIIMSEKIQKSIKLSDIQSTKESFVKPFPLPEFVAHKENLYRLELDRPRPITRLVTTEKVGQLPVAHVQVNPVRQVSNGILEFHHEIEITITYNKTKQTDDSENLSPVQAQRLLELAQEQVVNPCALLISKNFPHLFDIDYLIITDNNSWDAKTILPTGRLNGDLISIFQRLADWKTRRGLKTRVISVSDIVNRVYGNFASGARDLQEVIRNFVKWAYVNWRISWVLLGGDTGIIPVRQVAGAEGGQIMLDNNDPPLHEQSYWAGSYLKMYVTNRCGIWWVPSVTNILVRIDNGSIIPYDTNGTSNPLSAGWYFTTDGTYTIKSSGPTEYVRVNGPEAEVRTNLRFLYPWNMIPTDLYYASLVGPNYNLPGKHDWDMNDNGIYGQHDDCNDTDGVNFHTDISVGRAPVDNIDQANMFVDKVISYEQFRTPTGALLDVNWPRKMLFASSNWFGPEILIYPTASDPPTEYTYHHNGGQPYSRIQLQGNELDSTCQLFAIITDTDSRVIPFNINAARDGRGWYYAVSSHDLTPCTSGFRLWPTTTILQLPVKTPWVVVCGQQDELTPQLYGFGNGMQDSSMSDQEILRKQMSIDLSNIDIISRLYEDEVDLTNQAGDPPVKYLSGQNMQEELNAVQHFVSLSGHGDPGGCCYLRSNVVQNLTNGYHPFITYADSCLTNQFEAEDAISESITYKSNGGAVGYVGNSRFSWIGIGDNFQRVFFHALTSTHHLGLLNDVRCSLISEVGCRYGKWAIFSLNLIGDPEMPVWSGRPIMMIVNFPSSSSKHKKLTINVSGSFLRFFKRHLLGATVCIQQGSVSQIAFTDSNGNATFDASNLILGKLEITVTLTGCIPFLGTLNITNE